jgi:hypothetical protein
MRTLLLVSGNLKRMALQVSFCTFAAFYSSFAWSEDFHYRILENVPQRIEERRAQEHKENLNALEAIPHLTNMHPYLVILESDKWIDGRIITVAFKGGTTELHEKIAAVASQWSDYANIRFDFGRDPATGKFRTWSVEDKDYQADIRIAFDALGYWSTVGTESRDPKIIVPNEASMNFHDFDQGTPVTWEGTVRHEFGHALGLEHEHQHPAQVCDWRWTDEDGYQVAKDKYGQVTIDKNGKHPSIYRVLGGPPNNWPPEQVDSNLRQLSDSSAYGFGKFDKFSIMKYYFESWMFIDGERSDCYSAGGNNEFSNEDKTRVAEFYPKNSDAARTQVQDRIAEISRLAPRIASSRVLSSKFQIKLQQLQ